MGNPSLNLPIYLAILRVLMKTSFPFLSYEASFEVYNRTFKLILKEKQFVWEYKVVKLPSYSFEISYSILIRFIKFSLLSVLSLMTHTTSHFRQQLAGVDAHLALCPVGEHRGNWRSVTFAHSIRGLAAVACICIVAFKVTLAQSGHSADCSLHLLSNLN